jgi:hypothetical protein
MNGVKVGKETALVCIRTISTFTWKGWNKIEKDINFQSGRSVTQPSYALFTYRISLDG